MIVNRSLYHLWLYLSHAVPTCSIPVPSSSMVPAEETCSFLKQSMLLCQSNGLCRPCLENVTMPFGTETGTTTCSVFQKFLWFKQDFILKSCFFVAWYEKNMHHFYLTELKWEHNLLCYCILKASSFSVHFHLYYSFQDSLLVRVSDSWSKGCKFESWQLVS